MRPHSRPLCDLCEYYTPGVLSDSGQPECRAFPNGIPDEILHGGADHRKPIANETITFKLKQGVPPEAVEEWEQERLEQKKAETLALMGRFQSEEPDEA